MSYVSKCKWCGSYGEARKCHIAHSYCAIIESPTRLSLFSYLTGSTVERISDTQLSPVGLQLSADGI